MMSHPRLVQIISLALLGVTRVAGTLSTLGTFSAPTYPECIIDKSVSPAHLWPTECPVDAE